MLNLSNYSVTQNAAVDYYVEDGLVCVAIGGPEPVVVMKLTRAQAEAIAVKLLNLASRT